MKVNILNFPRHSYQYLVGWLGLSFCILMYLGGCSSVPQSSSTVPSLTTTEPITTQYPQPSLTPEIQFYKITNTEQPSYFNISQYLDPQDLFSIYVPDHWLILRNQSTSVFTDTQEEPAIQIDIVNTGYVLDTKSFNIFFETREEDRASKFENYVEITRLQLYSPNSIQLTRQCFHQDCRKILVTLYMQQEQAILMLDCLVQQDLYLSYQDFFKTLTNFIKINSDKVSNLQVYSFDQAKMYSNGYYSILTPPYWGIKQSRGENSIVDTITSPDEQSIIQTIVYDDGKTMSRNIAGNLVLTLLNKNYAKGIMIETDEILKDGREKITWRSGTANYRGITLFETQESAMFVVTVIWGNDPDRYYQNILEDIINSYKVEVP